ncbi:uncharacterized protein LY79DRAFT_578458 [Colletotrichum navitas]|uniref:Uncharacterized protein n=1 Tax=Colletotrichum navitas TaxID=681940 RepID=A0AAD8Q4F8_9PEZI|nr:uncharacterized protein LY79DRAFT_578458 [Colletotrichum navitas]KAK1594882.1 hypothetical protein LY79DRAFT_578458 [Colletotrichum navitas]
MPDPLPGGPDLGTQGTNPDMTEDRDDFRRQEEQERGAGKSWQVQLLVGSIQRPASIDLLRPRAKYTKVGGRDMAARQSCVRPETFSFAGAPTSSSTHSIPNYAVERLWIACAPAPTLVRHPTGWACSGSGTARGSLNLDAATSQGTGTFEQ